MLRYACILIEHPVNIHHISTGRHGVLSDELRPILSGDSLLSIPGLSLNPRPISIVTPSYFYSWVLFLATAASLLVFVQHHQINFHRKNKGEQSRDDLTSGGRCLSCWRRALWLHSLLLFKPIRCEYFIN
jgi:hypothetical protein